MANIIGGGRLLCAIDTVDLGGAVATANSLSGVVGGVKLGLEFAGHGTVKHSINEYVRGGFWHTNMVENYFSILKRGITGTYHHVSQQHLKRYLAEFDFRHNERAALGVDDTARTTKALGGIVGKRLLYRDSSVG